jgi:hypothetical protein
MHYFQSRNYSRPSIVTCQIDLQLASVPLPMSIFPLWSLTIVLNVILVGTLQSSLKDEENISNYFKRVDNVVNAIIGLGVEVSDNELVEKILRTLPILYNPKLSTLEDRENLDKLTMDEFYGILTAYELILGHENLPKGEASFKVLKKTKNQKKKPQPSHHE